MTNPLEFVDENDKFIDKEKLDDLFATAYSIRGAQLPKEEKLAREKKSFLKKMISLMKDSPQLPKASTIYPFLAPALGDSGGQVFSLYQKFEEFCESFTNNLQLPDIIIHAIVYTGPRERLPLVFEHLNTTSVTLSKYEIFSSQWPTKKMVVRDEEIIKSVWSKYSRLKDSSNFEVDTTEETIRNDGLTLFEYCFALSEILNNSGKPYSFVFAKSKKSTDPTGFDILAMACGLPANRADLLSEDKYLGGSSSGNFLVDLKDAIIDSIETVATTIRPWVMDLRGSQIKNASQYQIYHMIMSVFKSQYELDLNSKTITKRSDRDSSEWSKNFSKYAYKWYLYHRITNFWNTNRQVSDLKRLLDGDESKDFYVTNISRDQWDTALSDYDSRTRKSATTRAIEPDTKLLLNYHYRLLRDEDRNREVYFEKTDTNGDSIDFDIEHIVPVSKFGDNDEELPISAIGNLCYLPVKDNRSKRDKTIYEYALDRPSLTFHEDFLKLIDYPSRTELEFIDCQKEEFVSQYEKLVDARTKRLFEKFVNLLMVN